MLTTKHKKHMNILARDLNNFRIFSMLLKINGKGTSQQTFVGFEDVLKNLWRQAKGLLEISVSKKSKCISKKSMFHKSLFDKPKANPKCIN